MNENLRSPSESVALIEKLVNQNDIQAALNLAENSVRAWPNDIALLIVSARLANNIGRVVAAVELYSRAADLRGVQAARENKLSLMKRRHTGTFG